MFLDDALYELSQIPPELRRVLAVISQEGGMCLLSLSELSERAKVPDQITRSVLRGGVEKGIIRIRRQGRKRPRRYAIEIISPSWLRYLTAAARGGRLVLNGR